jgi:hypothetical protein
MATKYNLKLKMKGMFGGVYIMKGYETENYLVDETGRKFRKDSLDEQGRYHLWSNSLSKTIILEVIKE